MQINIPQTSQGGADSGGSAETYTVQPGDTLEGIADKFGVGLDKLISANFKDGYSGQLQPGQELRIPAGENVEGYIVYTVQEGDTPDSIAAQFNIGVSDLFRANPQLANHPLLSGSTVKVPQLAGEGPEKSLPQSLTMKLGDTLAEIAKRFDIPLDSLMKANPHVGDPNKTSPGTVLKFPETSAKSREDERAAKSSEDNPSVRAFALDNLSKARFQMLEFQRQADVNQPGVNQPAANQTPVPGFGVPQQVESREEDEDQPSRQKRKRSIPAPFDQWADLIYEAGEKYSIDPPLIAAIIWRESGGNNIVTNHKYGLMQIDGRRYGDWLRKNHDGLDPASNIDFGVSILRSCFDRFPGDSKAALTAFKREIDTHPAESSYAFDVLSQEEYFKRFF